MRAGRKRFAEQSQLARSKREKPWMAQVRAYSEAGKIEHSITAYARKFQRWRNLNPPRRRHDPELISKLRREEEAEVQASQ